MSGPKSFRIHAEECVRLATIAADPEHRSLLLGMAQCWVVWPTRPSASRCFWITASAQP